jgi:predicted aconitase with swiveling domain
MATFKGRPIVPGNVTAEALVTHAGFNTLASFQKALMFGDKAATCSDQNNPDLYGKQMLNKALCLPQTIGSTTGGMVIYCACAMERQPACMLFSNPIDSLAAAGRSNRHVGDIPFSGNVMTAQIPHHSIVPLCHQKDGTGVVQFLGKSRFAPRIGKTHLFQCRHSGNVSGSHGNNGHGHRAFISSINWGTASTKASRQRR